ncbi:hypothetical protein [Williamsia sp.]|uniref:hypothetical protein n=1 Tax=Williamsia sp. TaxID=1872085 RepID=UPI002F9475BC
MLRQLLLPISGRFWTLLDSESMRLYQALKYTAIFVMGLYMSAYTAPTSTHSAFGDIGTPIWVSMTMICPALTLLGVHWSRLGRVIKIDAANTYTGYWMQFAGDIGVAGLLLAYVVAVVQESWSKGLFAAGVVFAVAIGCSLLAVRDIRKVIQAEKEKDGDGDEENSWAQR